MSGPQYKHLVRRMLPKNVSDAWEKFMHFRPYDWMEGLQTFPTRFEVKGVESIKGYRYPAPGSQTIAHVPELEADDDRYDTNHYKHDTTRAPMRVLQMYPAKHALAAGESTPVLTAGPEEATQRGSPAGRLNPAVAKYDPTGLRHAMSASHDELAKELQRVMPNHLTQYEWAGDLQPDDADQDTPTAHRSAKQIAMFTKNNGLPPLPGVPSKYAGVHGLFMPTDPETYEDAYVQF